MGIINPVAGENIDDFKNVLAEDLRNEVLGLKRVLQELNINVIEINTTGNIREKLMMEELAIICHGIAVIPKDFSSPVLNVNVSVPNLNICVRSGVCSLHIYYFYKFAVCVSFMYDFRLQSFIH